MAKAGGCRSLMETGFSIAPDYDNAEWFQALFEQHRESLYRYALRLTKDPDDAQDLLQESAAAAFHQIGSLRDRAAFSQWVRAIIRNTYRTYCRNAGRSRLVQDELAKLDLPHAFIRRADSPDEEQIERVLRSAQSLPVKYREILVLRFIEEMPYQKIAKALDLPESTISRRVAYARQSLIKAFQEAETMEQSDKQGSEGLDEKIGELLPIHRAAALGALNEVERLIASGVDINARDEIMGATPLFWAVLQGRKEMVQLLLDRGADINAADTDLGFTPLHVAALVADRDISEILLKYGADATIKDKSGKFTPSWLAFSRISIGAEQPEDASKKLRELGARVNTAGPENNMTFSVFGDRGAFDAEPTPGQAASQLFVAILGGDRHMVEHLLNECDVNVKIKAFGAYTCTPLHFAVLCEQYEMVDLLLSKGAKMSVEGIQLDPIHWAAAMNKVEMLEFLVSRGANIHPTAEKTGPLLTAAGNGRIAAAGYLIDKGADVNVRDGWGAIPRHAVSQASPLILAILGGQVEMVEFLLSRGADLWKSGSTIDCNPLHLACGSGIIFERQRAMADFLISKGIDVNSRVPESPQCEFGNSALAVAAGYALCVKMMDHLISKGADIHSRSESGRTILHNVAAKQVMARRWVIDFIVGHGVPVDAQDDFGESPLHVAARKGVRRTAEYLIQIGANPKLRDKKGRTPEMAAREVGEVAVADFLREQEKN